MTNGERKTADVTALRSELTRVVRANADIFEALGAAIKKDQSRMLEALPAAPGAADPTVAEGIIHELCNCPVLKDILGMLPSVLGL